MGLLGRIGTLLGLAASLFQNGSCTPKDEALTEHAGSHSQAVVIDVRTPEEFRNGHIEGAINIPYDEIGQKIKSQVPAKETPVFLYCRSGRRSGIAAKALRSLGYKQVEDGGGMSKAKARLDSMRK